MFFALKDFIDFFNIYTCYTRNVDTSLNMKLIKIAIKWRIYFERRIIFNHSLEVFVLIHTLNQGQKVK